MKNHTNQHTPGLPVLHRTSRSIPGNSGSTMVSHSDAGIETPAVLWKPGARRG
ncbi:MAG: hypothetical protein LBU25_05930 [Treponema sp.]|nr:hypothetical protein [Treponema sp.]